MRGMDIKPIKRLIDGPGSDWWRAGEPRWRGTYTSADDPHRKEVVSYRPFDAAATMQGQVKVN